MADTFTSNLRFTEQTVGGNANTWGGINNAQFQLIEEALTKIEAITDTSGTRVLTTANGATDEARSMMLHATGTLSGNLTIEVPALPKVYLIRNATSGAFTLTVKVNGQTGVLVTQGKTNLVYCDGTDINPTNVAEADNAATATLAADSTLAAGLTPSTFLQDTDYNNELDGAALSTKVVALAPSATPTPDIDNAQYFTYTPDQAFALQNPVWTNEPADAGQWIPFTIFFTQNNLAAMSMTFDTNYKTSFGGVIDLTQEVSALDVMSCIWDRDNDVVYTSMSYRFE